MMRIGTRRGPIQAADFQLASSICGPKTLPRGEAPKPRIDTLSPVLPRGRFCMLIHVRVGPVAKMLVLSAAGLRGRETAERHESDELI